MGCSCTECALQLHEGRDRVDLFKRSVGARQANSSASESQLPPPPNPLAVEHFDHYVVYNADQALPRYLISFTVNDIPPPPPPEAPPCWLCSDPPYKVQEAHTTIELHMTGQSVPVCFNCAGKFPHSGFQAQNPFP